jgi:hypothetical protein
MVPPYIQYMIDKGYTETLIKHLALTNPQRLWEWMEDPWSFPFLGDRSAPVQYNPPMPKLQLYLK